MLESSHKDVFECSHPWLLDCGNPCRNDVFYTSEFITMNLCLNIWAFLPCFFDLEEEAIKNSRVFLIKYTVFRLDS
jgi:hypothetical protein